MLRRFLPRCLTVRTVRRTPAAVLARAKRISLSLLGSALDEVSAKPSEAP